MLKIAAITTAAFVAAASGQVYFSSFESGADGFVGQNLQLHLAERADVAVRRFTRANTLAELPALLQGVDWVFHLAGVNRPQDPTEFTTGNADLTQALHFRLQQLTHRLIGRKRGQI